jgi:serine carboxypeptidase 1
VYNGQLDLICCTLGTDAWMEQLRWKGMRGFMRARMRPFYLKREQGGRTAGFARAHKNLAEFVILNAGHMIPSDQPRTALHVLDRILFSRSAAEPRAVSVS